MICVVGFTIFQEKAPYVAKAEKRKVEYEKNIKAYNKKLVNQMSIMCQF